MSIFWMDPYNLLSDDYMLPNVKCLSYCINSDAAIALKWYELDCRKGILAIITRNRQKLKGIQLIAIFVKDMQS